MMHHIKFTFTRDETEELVQNVWTVSVARRIIHAELDILPYKEQSGGDIRYETDDADVFVKLLRIAFEHAESGWWRTDDMTNVFHIH